MRSALLSAKKKTISLLNRGADILLTAEAPEGVWLARLGPAPNIYSREINYWVFAAALDILRNRPEIGLVYIHTTDYPMHMWPPAAPESREHLARLDDLLGELAETAPDAAILVTADHGMNFKSRCWDLEKAMQQRGARSALRFPPSATATCAIIRAWAEPPGFICVRAQTRPASALSSASLRASNASSLALRPRRN